MTRPGQNDKKALLMERIDRTLPTLPRNQQNLVACYALGLRDGLRLRERASILDTAEARTAPVPFPSAPEQK